MRCYRHTPTNNHLPTRTRDKLHGRNIELPSPPTCEAKPEVKINIHGDEVVDNYAWLKDRENPDGKGNRQNLYSPTLTPSSHYALLAQLFVLCKGLGFCAFVDSIYRLFPRPDLASNHYCRSLQISTYVK